MNDVPILSEDWWMVFSDPGTQVVGLIALALVGYVVKAVVQAFVRAQPTVTYKGKNGSAPVGPSQDAQAIIRAIERLENVVSQSIGENRDTHRDMGARIDHVAADVSLLRGASESGHR